MTEPSLARRRPHHPWYREPWPWLLMAGPAAVVIASAVTLYLAVSTNDGLVADDYYKQGLAINQTLARADRARALKLEADLRFDGDTIEVALHGGAAEARPESLHLSLIHAGHAGMDRSITLERSGEIYRGPTGVVVPGRWQIVVEDRAGTWRLSRWLRLPDETSVRIAAQDDVHNEKGR